MNFFTNFELFKIAEWSVVVLVYLTDSDSLPVKW